MKDELRSYMDRPKRYENIDGTGEMSMGLMLLGFALLLVLLFMALGLLAIDFTVGGDVSELWPSVALFVGLVWLGSGGATLFAYLRHTQRPALEAE